MKIEAMKLALEALRSLNAATTRERIRRNTAINALREALAEQPAQQEPVAWQHRKPIMDSQGGTRGYSDWLPGKGLEWWPHRALYTSPPAQRTWVGLTEPERLACYDLNPARFASAIEAKLKEKNT